MTTPDEVKRLARQLANAAFNAGYEDAGDAWTRQEKTEVKMREALRSLYAAIDALAAQAAQPVSPTAWMWQHPETGHTGFVENCTEEERRHWERVNRPRVFVCPLYASPQADTQPEEKPE